jgi:hypothetical protein
MIKKGHFFCILEYNKFSSTILCILDSFEDILSWDPKRLPTSKSNKLIPVTKYFFSCVVPNDYVSSLSYFVELDNSFVLSDSYNFKLDVLTIRTAVYLYWFRLFIHLLSYSDKLKVLSIFDKAIDTVYDYYLSYIDKLNLPVISRTFLSYFICNLHFSHFQYYDYDYASYLNALFDPKKYGTSDFVSSDLFSFNKVFNIRVLSFVLFGLDVSIPYSDHMLFTDQLAILSIQVYLVFYYLHKLDSSLEESSEESLCSNFYSRLSFDAFSDLLSCCFVNTSAVNPSKVQLSYFSDFLNHIKDKYE